MATFDTLPEVTTSLDADYILIRQGGQARKITKANYLKELSALGDDITALKDMTFFSVVSSDGHQTVKNSAYHIVGDINVVLPDTAGMVVGDQIKFTKDQDNAPTITVFDTGTQNIQTTKGNDTSVIFDINAEIIFTFNGTNLEV